MIQTGYSPDFIGHGIKVPLPKLSPGLNGVALRNDVLRETVYLDYYNFSVTMNITTKQLIFSASNIDQNKSQQVTRNLSKDWDTDSRIDINDQLDNRYYKENDWDRGHMVQRANNSWGENFGDALKANDDTFYYTNAAFQHKFFNQDEWLKLEQFIGSWMEDTNGKLCIFTGPIHNKFDRLYARDWHNTVRIPSGFFKIVCFHSSKSNKLESRAFILYQDNAFINNKNKGSREIKLKNYQVTVAEIEELTGLDFDDSIAINNPLYYSSTHAQNVDINVFPERIPVEKEGDIVHEIDEPRPIQEAKPLDKNIVIAAAMVNPSGSEASKEWIVLLNITSGKVDLDGWRIDIIKMKSDGEINAKVNYSIDLTSYKSIAPGESLTVFCSGHKARLVNYGSTIALYNRQNDLVDRELYTENEVEEREDFAIRF